MNLESFKITYTTTQRIRAIKVDSPGLVSFSMFSENLTSAAKVNLYTSNFADIDRAVPYAQLSSITTNNEGHHENLRDVNSTYLIVEVDYQSSTAGEVSFNLNFIPEQSFFLNNRLGEQSPLSVAFGDSASLDAFGLLKVGEPTNRFDAEFTYDKLEEIFDEILGSGGGTVTHNANARHLLLETTGNGLLESAEMRSFPIPYTAGSSQTVEITSVLNYGNIADGVAQLFLRSKVTGSVVEEVYDQEDWNCNEVSTYSLHSDMDWSSSHIFDMDFQSLKVGRIRYRFNRKGKPICVHEICNDNIRNTGYLQNPSLPVYYKVYNDASYTYMEIGYGNESNAIGIRYRVPLNIAGQMTAICCTVKSGGAKSLFDMTGYPQSADSGVTAKTVSTSIIPLLSIRQNSTFNSIENLCIAVPKEISVQTNNPIRLIVYHDATLTGASWVDVDATHSTMEYDVTASALSGGHIIQSEYVATSKNIQASAKGLLGKAVLWHRQNGNSGILTVAAVRSDTTNASVLTGIKWEEIR